MTESSQDSCFTKAKKSWIEFYRSPFFLMKLLSVIIILGLAIFGLFKIVTSALYHFGEPLSYFDPERLGQLGDFLGGTLNPFFGFATVCLLLWSVFIQRKELSLTRAELKKSSDTLNNQFNLATDDYNRKALEEELVENNDEYMKLLDTKFSEIFVTSINEDGTESIPFQATNLKRVLSSATKNTNQVSTNVFSTPPKIIHPIELRYEIEENIEDKVDIYTQLIAATRSNIVRNNKRKKILRIVDIAKKAGFISEKVAEKYIHTIGAT